MKKLLPLILLLIGTAAGGGVGYVMRPPPPEEPAEMAKDRAEGGTNAEKSVSHSEESETPVEYVKLNNQFVVPVVKNRVVISLVVMALSVEAPEGSKEAIFKREPKLRDSFLQVLFDHANAGGFDGAFTEASAMNQLRGALREVAQRDLGEEMVKDVLILEIARQDY